MGRCVERGGDDGKEMRGGRRVSSTCPRATWWEGGVGV